MTTAQYEEQQAKLINKSEQLDRNAFLQLFTTQLKNQNPLDPMENEAFVSQLAQFSSLEAMTAMRASIEQMANDSRAEKFVLGSALIGKSIDRVSGLIDVEQGETIVSKGDLPYPSPKGVFSVTNPSTGELVYRQIFENLPAGGMQIAWDGKNFMGQPSPSGIYEVELVVDKEGEPVVVPLINPQTIKAVSWDEELGEMMVEISDGSRLNISDISRIES
jgi:flagellar basal-body rod modification protein FlgD